jgi:hypothetical protein
VVIMSTRAVPIHRQEFRRLARRGRFRPFRIAGLLTVVRVIRLVQASRLRWRLITGLAGLLIEVVGFNVLSGGPRDLSSLVGMVLLLFAMMKDAKSCSSCQVGIPQATRPPC